MSDDVEHCEACGGPLVWLGALGAIGHYYRCRNCGLDVQISPASEPEPEPEPEEQCGQCGAVILGAHGCLGVPGGFSDDPDD